MQKLIFIIAVITASIFFVSCEKNENSDIIVPSMEFSIDTVQSNQTYELTDIVENLSFNLIQGFRYEVIVTSTQETLDDYSKTFQHGEVDEIKNFSFSVDNIGPIIKNNNIEPSNLRINLQLHRNDSNTQEWIELTSKTAFLDYKEAGQNDDTDTTDIWPDSAPWNQELDTIYYDKYYSMFTGERGETNHDDLFQNDSLFMQQIDYERGDVKMHVYNNSDEMVYWEGIWENGEQNMHHHFKIEDPTISRTSSYRVEIEVTLHQGGTHIDTKTFPLGFN